MVETYTQASPYFETIQRNDLVPHLDFFEFRNIPEDDTDIALTVDPAFHQRPDLLSHDLYGTPDLWWIFIVRNPDQIVDPIYGLVAGLDLFVPTKDRAFSALGL